MKEESKSVAESRAERLYRLLLTAYPRPFRRRYGDLMVQLFLDQRRNRLGLRGRWGLWSFWRESLGDILWNAAAERARWQGRRRPLEPRRGRLAAAKENPMSAFFLDLKFTLRSLSKNRTFAGLAVGTLALGIGANSAIFSVVNAVLLNPLPFDDAGRLTVVWENDRLRGTDREGASGPDYFDFKAAATAFQPLTGYRRLNGSVTSAGAEPEKVRISAVSRDFFDYYGWTPALGRPFTAEEDAPGGPAAALLSHAFWQRRLGGNPGVLEQTLTIDGEPYRIVGVMPSGRLPFGESDLWVPLQWGPSSSRRGNHSMTLLGKLREGTSLQTAQEEMSALAAALEEKYPDDNLGRGILVSPLQEEVVGDVRPLLWALLAGVGLVLAIACANVANLLLARSALRRREIAVRTALGAAGFRLVRQFLAESLLLALAAGTLGVLLAHAGVRLLTALGPADLPRLEDVSVDGRVLLFTALVSLATAALFGLIPVLHALRIDLTRSLQLGGRADIGGNPWTRRLLVSFQLALSVVLLVGSGLLIQTFRKLQEADPGFAHRDVLTLDLSLPASRYPQDLSKYPNLSEVIQFQDRLLEQVKFLPGVSAAAVAVNHPLRSGWTTRFRIEGRPPVPEGEQQEATVRPVSPEYFDTVGVRLLRGRFFTPQDRVEAPAVAILNESMVRRHFSENEDPLKKWLGFWGVQRQIVGIIQDVRFDGIARPTPPAMYVPLPQVPISTFSLLVRSSGDPLKLVQPVQAEIWALDRDLAVSEVTTLRRLLDDAVGQPRFSMILWAIFAAVSLALAMVGVYGLMNYAVTRRTQEIGVRVALGASRGDIVRLMVSGGLGLAGAGALFGLAAAALLARFLQGMLYGVGPTDPATFAGAALLLLATALAACLFPARRAAGTDPLTALRCD